VEHHSFADGSSAGSITAGTADVGSVRLEPPRSSSNATVTVYLPCSSASHSLGPGDVFGYELFPHYPKLDFAN